MDGFAGSAGGDSAGQNQSRQQEVLVLTALAKQRLGTSLANELLSHLPELISVMQHPGVAGVSALAARGIAYLVAERRDEDLARSLVEVMATAPEDGLDSDGIGYMALARAMVLYQARMTSASLKEVITGIEKLEHLGAANLVMVQLHEGLGAINSRNGCYQAALEAQKKGYQMAVRLGNDTLIRSLAGNLSMCCARLGRYDEQSWWLSQGPRTISGDFTGFVEVQIAYFSALSHVHKGRRDLVDEVVTALDRRLIGSIPKSDCANLALI